MKNNLIRIILASALAMWVSPVRAEDHQTIMAELLQKKVDHTVDILTKFLSLSPEQQASIKAMLIDQDKKMADFQKEWLAKGNALRDNNEQQVLSVLTVDQKAGYPNAKARLKEEEEQKNSQHKNLLEHENEGMRPGPSGGMHHHGNGGGNVNYGDSPN